MLIVGDTAEKVQGSSSIVVVIADANPSALRPFRLIEASLQTSMLGFQMHIRTAMQTHWRERYEV